MGLWAFVVTERIIRTSAETATFLNPTLSENVLSASDTSVQRLKRRSIKRERPSTSAKGGNEKKRPQETPIYDPGPRETTAGALKDRSERLIRGPINGIFCNA